MDIYIILSTFILVGIVLLCISEIVPYNTINYLEEEIKKLRKVETIRSTNEKKKRKELL